jgi:hypothetical protein
MSRRSSLVPVYYSDIFILTLRVASFYYKVVIVSKND